MFPNSTYIKWKRRWNPDSVKDLMVIAKERECTSLVLVDANPLGHGACMCFYVLDVSISHIFLHTYDF